MKLLRHTLFNLIGLGAPLLVAVGSIPVLIHELGPSRFGLLTLVWAVVSYFGLFDLGLGRALTQQLAIVLSNKDFQKVGPLVGTATVLLAILGVMAGLLMASAASWGVGLIKDVPNQREAIDAVYAMALAMPFIVLTSGFRGILEAKNAFGIINLIRLPMGLFTFLGPLAVIFYGPGPRLDHIAQVLVAGRIIACGVHAYCAWRILAMERSELVWRADLVKPLCISGGWLTVSNIVSPFMGYVDRFVIGAIVSASAVAYYTTPQELITKLWIVPGALTAVLFPAFAAQIARRDDQTWVLFKKAVYWLFIVLLPVTVALTLFAHELLAVWINPGFADHSAALLKVFAVGILINCLAHVPFTLIQSAGAARLTALTHFIELPFFLVALWWLTSSYGVLGAAIAWLLRMVFDTSLMFILCCPLLGRPVKSLISSKVVIFALVTAAGFAGVLFEPLPIRVLWMFLLIGLLAVTLVTSSQSRGERCS